MAPDDRCHNNGPIFAIHTPFDCPASFQYPRVNHLRWWILYSSGRVLPGSTSAVCSVGGRVTGHRIPCTSYAGCQHRPAEKRLDLVFLVSHYCKKRNLFGGARHSARFTLLGPGNEEEWERPTLIDFAEIGSLQSSPCEKCKPRAGEVPTELASSKFSDKCHPSPLDGYCASSPRLIALSQLQDADLRRSIGLMKWCVGVAQTLLRLVLMLCTKDLWQGDGCHADKRAGCTHRLLCRVRPLGVAMRSQAH